MSGETGGTPVGDAGTGKTLLCLQALVHGCLEGQSGIFVSLEESSEDLATSAEALGWSSQTEHDQSDAQLHFVTNPLTPETIMAGSFDLSALLNGASVLIRRSGAKRVVFDAIDVLLDLLDNPQDRKRELLRLQEWAHNNDVLCLLTAKEWDTGSEVGEDRYGFLKYVADGVIRLRRREGRGISSRTIQITKMRRSTHALSEYPLWISGSGLSVRAPDMEEMVYPASDKRMPTGIDRLDAMLSGGYLRGSTVLVSGAPGTAKSTLAGSFAAASAARGEKTVYLSFDESVEEIVRNFASVNVQLRPLLEQRSLAMESWRAYPASIDEHHYRIVKLLDQEQPRVFIMDPISSFARIIGQPLGGELAERILSETKKRQITTLMTSMSVHADEETTQATISTVADTWIHLSFNILRGERNRALTIVKARGTGHSNQVRELILSDGGITLTDVYAAGGEVLMGTARLERELEALLGEERNRQQFEADQQEIAQDQASLQAQMEQTQARLESLRRRNEFLLKSEQLRKAGRSHVRDEILRVRQADAEGSGPHPDQS